MGILALAADERVADVKFTKDTLSVALRDGRTITVPLAWYPRLFNATAAQRKNWRIAGGGYGIHWPDVDEDLSTEGLLRGAPPRARHRSRLRATPDADQNAEADRAGCSCFRAAFGSCRPARSLGLVVRRLEREKRTSLNCTRQSRNLVFQQAFIRGETARRGRALSRSNLGLESGP